MTTILFDSTRPVKPVNRLFGLGLAKSRPTRQRFQPTPEDIAWNAETSPLNRSNYEVVGPTAYDLHVDQMAQEAAWQASYEAGYVAC